MRLLTSVLSATLVSGSLWLWDLLRLSSYNFAGVTDQAAADRVLSVTGSAITAMELELLVVHLLLGGVFGLLCGLTWQTLGTRLSRARRAVLTAALTFVAFTLALFGMVGTYPQLFADKWWLAGGGLATLQRLITHSIGPRFFDVCLVLLLLALVAASLVRGRRTLSSAKKGATRAYAVAALFVLLFAVVLRTGLGATAPQLSARRNLLILAADSLRSDRLEDPEVMPNMAARLDQGSLFRHAITPIARTYPAWVSTLTGTEPRRHGVRHMFPTKQARRDVGPTLFTTLRDRGYFTFATSDFAGDVFPGFEGGFEVLDTPHLNVDTLAT